MLVRLSGPRARSLALAWCGEQGYTWFVEFEWDQRKADLNLKKHGVSFEEARTLFRDPFARIFDDEAHSADEQREIIIGHSLLNRLILVCFTERAGRIRIVSARSATPKERQDYEENATV